MQCISNPKILFFKTIYYFYYFELNINPWELKKKLLKYMHWILIVNIVRRLIVIRNKYAHNDIPGC